MDEKANLCTRPCSEHAVAQRSLFIMWVGMSCMGTYYFLNTYYVLYLTYNTLHTFIIKFGYNARCHWLKERVL